MSGVEVVGLLLGAFPLLISALEHYREGAELLSDWWRIQRAYKKCKQDIEYHRILFESNVEEFLLPLVVDEAELRVLMANPAGEEWEDPELEERLKERLPKSYNLYLDIIGDINELMEKLKKELGIGNASFQSRVDESQSSAETKISRKDLLSISNVQFQAKRIRFSLKKSSRDKLFGELKECNDRMRNLLESSDRTSAAKHVRGMASQREQHMAHTKLGQFWCHAKKLHRALSQAWQCGCTSHEANLQLQHRTTEEIEFDVLFSMKTTPGAWGWQETKIKMLQNEPLFETVAIRVAATEDMPAHLATPQHRSMKSARPSALNKARWNASIQCVPNSSSTLASTTPPARPKVGWTTPDLRSHSGPNLQETGRIMDLCKILSKRPPTCFGFLEEDDSRFVLYPPTNNESTTNLTTITLANLLNGSTLTRRQRYSLALTLASSYLQLSSTPWLTGPLCKDDILFLHDKTNDDSTLLDRPYICRDFSPRTPADANRALSTLGIRLLELCFGTAIECHKIRQQLPAGDAISAHMLDYAAALQWSQTVSEEAGPEFAEAIEWCLHGQALRGDGWRKDIIRHVIDPLEYCHKQVALGRSEQ